MLARFQAPKHPFTVGNGLLAKLEGVVRAGLPSFFGLRARDCYPAARDGKDQNDSAFHRHTFPQR